MVCDTISCGLLGPESVLTNHLRRAELAVRSAARRAVCINPTMQMFVKAEVTPNDSTVSRGWRKAAGSIHGQWQLPLRVAVHEGARRPGRIYLSIALRHT